MPLFGRFSRKPDPAEADARARIRLWVEAALRHNPPDSLTISEIECGDPACPGLETIILVLRAGEATQAVKVRKPMIEACEADVIDAVKYL